MSDRARVIGVRFRNAGRIQYFDPVGMRFEPGEYVVVEGVRGPELGRVVIGSEQVVIDELDHDDLRPILRAASPADIDRAMAQRERADALLPEVRRLAAEARFPVRIDTADFTLDGRRLTLGFTSEERIDYREFVRKAGERFGARVDMRQLGPRDRARAAGGYGICGRELCCSNWLGAFPSISIRMAKEQELPLNPQKISGLCGRLLCCLSYEEEGYREMRRSLPKMGQRCSTPTGEGKVIAVNILRRQVTLLVEGERVEVSDRDLGTVVRWDTSSKAGAPPPSLTREEALAMGLDYPEEAEPVQPEAGHWLDRLDGKPPPVEGRGRLAGPQSPRPEPRSGARPSHQGSAPSPPAGRGAERPGGAERLRGRSERDSRQGRGSGQRPPPAGPPPGIGGAQARTFRRAGGERSAASDAPAGDPPPAGGNEVPRGRRRGRR
jgi:cell fate regulator YaaT (PSP1 superfamily)